MSSVWQSQPITRKQLREMSRRLYERELLNSTQDKPIHKIRRPIKNPSRALTKNLSRGLNRGELDFALKLDADLRQGKILAFWHEPINLRLAEKTYYRPDFVTVENDGTLTIYDVKGRKGAGYWCEEDAKVKIKVAAELYPCFRFRVVWPLPKSKSSEAAFGSWGVVTFPPHGTGQVENHTQNEQ